jgi:hypothetical protein
MSIMSVNQKKFWLWNIYTVLLQHVFNKYETFYI